MGQFGANNQHFLSVRIEDGFGKGKDFVALFFPSFCTILECFDGSFKVIFHRIWHLFRGLPRELP